MPGMPKPSLLQRLRAKKAARKPFVLPVAWYTPEHWALVKAAAVDPHTLADSYEAWANTAEQALSNVQAAGGAPLKLWLDPAELAAWCALNDRPNDAAARAVFLSTKMQQTARPGRREPQA